MNFQQILSGRIAGWIMQSLYGVRYTDMCPFRAIRRDALAKLDMREETYGWNLEMQMKTARAGLRILEIPVNHRPRRFGESKYGLGNRALRATVDMFGVRWLLARRLDHKIRER